MKKKTENIVRKISGVGVLLLFIFLIGWSVWGIMCSFGNYTDNVYQLDRVDQQFNRAHGTNNLETFADYTETGLIMLSRYNGNEAWWFPTIETDMDSIKIDIGLIINNSRLLANTTVYGSDAYQEALDNAKESLNVQRDRLKAVKWFYIGGGKSYIGLIWGWIFTLFAAIIIMGALANYRSNLGYN